MKIADSIGNAIDIAVAIVSPGRGLRRHYQREVWKRRSLLYAAAKTTKSTGAWAPVNDSVNLLIAASSASVRARVRQLVRDFPYFARAVNVLEDYVVGEGIIFQSKVKKPDGKLDTVKSQQIEDAFSFWADEADYSGRLHYYEMMALGKRQDGETGEFLMIKRYLKDKKRYLPYCLQMIEADWLTDMGVNPVMEPGQSEIEMGVEIDKKTGGAIAFHFTDPDGWGKTDRVLAENVIHGFQTMRPGQVRGISGFAPGVVVADDLSAIMDAEIDTVKMASKWLAIVKSMDPLGRQVKLPTQDGKKIEELENAIIEYLRPHEDIEIASNPRPGSNFPPFVRLILCMFSVTTGIPYELISGDYQGLNYSTGKMIRNDFKKALRPLWMRHIRQFCIPTTLPFFDSAVLTGKLDLPGYYLNRAPWVRSEWQPPGMEPIDPLRESKANIDDVNAVHRSPIEIIKARGREPEDVVKETAAFNELCEKYKVAPAEVSTALANNPAAVDQQKSEFRTALMEIMDALDELTARL
jgi:lambda family phage portal protein